MNELLCDILPISLLGLTVVGGILAGCRNLTDNEEPVLVKQYEEKQTIRRDPNKHYCINCGKEAIFNHEDITSRVRKQLGFCNKCYNTQVSFKR